MDLTFPSLRHTARFLTRQPAWTATVCLTLALGIGATTAIFSLVDAVLLRPLGFPHPEELVVAWESKLDKGGELSHVSAPTFLDWREEAVFADLAAFTRASYVVRGEEARSVTGMQVTPGFFRVLGVAPAEGRGFSEDEGRPGAGRVAVVSHGFWQRRLGGRPDAVGSELEASDETYTVIGILPPDFDLYESAEIFTPLSFMPEKLTEGYRGARYLRAIGRLRDGVGLAEARRAMEALSRRLAESHPNLKGWSAALVPWREQLAGSSRRALLLLLGAVVLVLAIASVNVASLLAARMATREREMAIRNALGADRRRLAAQVLVESVVLAALGGALGLLAAAWCVDSVKFVPWPIPRLDGVTIDGRVVLFTALVSLAAGLLTGLAPALALARPRLVESLREAGAAALGGGSGRLRSALTVVETALALVLLVAAGLFVRSITALDAVDPGFRPDGVVAAFQSLPAARYATEEGRRALARGLVARLGASPDVMSASVATNLPISGSSMAFGFNLPDRPQGPGDPERMAQYHAVGPRYFRTLAIPLVGGRDFDERDRDGAAPVAIVNRAFAGLYWPGEEALGRRLATAYDGVEREVVGVVGSVRHFGLDRAPQPELYVPYEQNPWQFLYLVARSVSGRTEPLPPAVRAAVATLDPELPVDSVASLEDLIASSLAPLRFQSLLVVLFGATALVLTMLGLYGVVAYSSARRTQEVAVRMALGARRLDVAWRFLRQGLALTLAGMVLGSFAALALARFLSGFLYGVTPRDPVTFTAIALLLGGVALVACLRPALRAAKADPMTALRCE